jgi:hypothetical protein
VVLDDTSRRNIMLRVNRTFGLTSLLATACVTAAAAQVTEACPEGQVVMGTIGIGDLDCEKCIVGFNIRADSGIVSRVWDFRSEPTVRRVVAGGPAAGLLQAGDVITAIDGQLITTRAGGVRYGALVPGTPVKLGIRRGGRDLEVTITPVRECVRVNVQRPAEPIVPRPAPVPRSEPRPPREPPQSVAVPRPAPAPRPWPSTSALGFSIRCTDCSLQRLDDPDRWVWSFSEPPVIERIEPDSPASKAGLRAGDVLTHIDGDRLVTAEGGRLFGGVKAGDRITLTYRRGSVEQTATLLAREAASWRGDVALPRERLGATGSAQPEITRYSGSLGDTVIQVTGGRVTVTRTDDEIVIKSSDITVRITRPGER